jgi:hypothetical protein
MKTSPAALDIVFKPAISSIVALCLLAMLFDANEARQRGAASHLRPQHQKIVDQWLAHRADLRLATEADCVNKDGLAAMRKERGRDYQPYYAVGDFNSDGQEDFAVALINKRKRRWKFAIAVFNGPIGAKSAPSFLDEQSDLSDGGFWVGSVRKGNRLVAGTLESDDCIILQPRRKGYVWKNCLAE